MTRLMRNPRFVRLALSAGVMLQLAGCGLSDRQLTQIAQTVITTSLNTIISSVVSAAIGTGA